MRLPLLVRLDAGDRALFSRLALTREAPRLSARAWILATHLGGATSAVLCVVLPLLLADGTLREAAALGAWSLLVSHVIVQLVKRRAVRPRPAPARDGRSLVDVPDHFSFPSGHACAAMSVAFSYGMAMPAMALPLTTLAVIVGMSRVRLGVHYPGDVLAGQAIAILAVLALWTLR